MATTTVTSIELNDNVAAQEPQSRAGASQGIPSNTNNGDDASGVMEMSRLADSAAPDGGRGWVVIAACAIISFWFTGVSYSWGVVQSALFEQGLSSAATLAYLGSIPSAIISAMAILNSRIVRAIGIRWTAVSGISILVLAQATASFATQNLAGMFCTAGVLLGLGMSLCFTACSVTPSQYFSKKRGLATGIVFAGGGLGGTIVTVAEGLLIQHLGIAWTYRILSLACLVTGIPAALLIKDRRTTYTSGFIEVALLKNARFVLIFFTGFIATFPLLVPAFFLPLYAHSIGLSSTVGSGLLAAFNLSSTLGRISCGWLSDRFGPLNTLISSLALGSLGMLVLWPSSTTLGPLAVFAIINGLSNGGYFATMPTIVGNMFGSARVAVAMGMIVSGWGPGYLMGGPIAGYWLDAYGGAKNGPQPYRPAMYYAGSLTLAAAGTVAVVKYRTQKAFFARA